VTDQVARPYLRTPTVSPDGKQIAFVSRGDIWLADSTGGRAERLTAHGASHWHPRFSPDCEALAFMSARQGRGDIYILPLRDGELQQVTFHEAAAAVEDWAADGQGLYFSSYRERIGSALFFVSTAGTTPVPIYAEAHEQLRYLSASPNGQWLAFTNMRDAWWRRGPNPFSPSEIWLGPTRPDPTQLRKIAGAGNANGHPALATAHAGRNCWPIWAVDSQGLYFVSDRDGVENLWFQPLDGAAPQQITQFRDGRLLFPAIARSSGLIVFERVGQLWRMQPGEEPEPIELQLGRDIKYATHRVEALSRGFSELALAPDGKKLAFVVRGEVFADFADKETDRERRSGPALRITNTPAREHSIAWSPESDGLIYISDRHGEDEIYGYSFAEQREIRITDDVTPKSLPTLSPDEKYLAFVCGHDAIDLVHTESRRRRRLTSGHFFAARSLAFSPDSRWLAFVAQDERYFSNVYVQRVDEENSVPRQITFLSNIHSGGLLWSPNGEFLLFTSCQYRDEDQIVRIDLRPNAPFFYEAEFEKLFQGNGKRNETPTKEAPSVAVAAEKSDSVEAIEPPAPPPDEPQPPVEPPAPMPEEPQPPVELPAEGPPVPTEEAAKPKEAPAEPEKKPERDVKRVDIVFEGIERRLRLLTPPAMDAYAHAISPDSRDLLFTAQVADKINIWALPLDELRSDQAARQLTASGSSKSDLQFAPDGKSFYYLEDGQVMQRKYPAGNEPLRIALSAEITVDTVQEKQQVFGEAWRLLRDNFYDQTLRGLDWVAERERIAPLVRGAQTGEELHSAINLMLGELRASHLGIGYTGSFVGEDGYLGAHFDPIEQLDQQRYRVSALVTDGPLALHPDAPKVGEYLVSVNGVALSPASNLDVLLSRSVGCRVKLGWAATPGGKAREIAIRPIDNQEYERLRYRDWVLWNERYVHRISKGRLGYVHIEEMSQETYQQLLADLDAETHSKDGVVVDVRYNNGGHTATFMIDVLMRRLALRSGFRDKGSLDASHMAGNRVLNKPTVLVTNEHSVSNAEIFAESYRQLGLGKIVGKPTAGAVIWTTQRRMLDGSSLRLPRFYVVTPDGEDLEGTGRRVDIEVDQPLGERAAGRDRQLDVAVATLGEALEQDSGFRIQDSEG
jgi:Tol biopolymer transport system component/C-terminal processing protease CtpA/Prc